MRSFRLFALLVAGLLGLSLPIQASAHRHFGHGHGHEHEFRGEHWGHRHGGPAPRVVVIDRGIHLPAPPLPHLGLPRPGLPPLPALPPLPRLPLP